MIDPKATDFGYINVIINNNSDAPVSAIFSEERAIPYVSEVENFQIALTRLKVPSSSIPLFQFANLDIVGNSPYWVALALGPSLNGGGATPPIFRNVIWEQQRAHDQKRFVYSYTAFLNMINKALGLLWDDARNAGGNPWGLGGYNTSTAPFFQLENNSPAITMNLPSNALEPYGTPFYRFDAAGVEQPTNIHLFMSPQLYMFFAGFPTYYYGITGALNDPRLAYDMTIKLDTWKLSQNKTTINGSGTLVTNRLNMKYYPDYTSLHLWQQLSRIFIVSNMPIQFEALASKDDNGVPRTIEMLQDFEIPPNDTGIQKENIYYFAQGPPRFHNFKVTGELRRLDLQFYFQMSDLSIYPINVLPGFEISAKVLLERRLNQHLKMYHTEDPGNRYTGLM
jgi:hypothetical protein